MLQYLKNEANLTHTENGAVTYLSTQSECLDLFATIGALRRESDEEITNRFLRAYVENADLASLICSGKGNEDWNCSAPHGAGRLMSRKAAFNALSMEEFQKEMEGIYTTCVVPDTLDESPMAYKSMEEIVAQIGPTAEIIERIRPVYNFKAAD